MTTTGETEVQIGEPFAGAGGVVEVAKVAVKVAEDPVDQRVQVLRCRRWEAGENERSAGICGEDAGATHSHDPRSYASARST